MLGVVFAHAILVGGDAVKDRFEGIWKGDGGLTKSVKSSRGIFVENTFKVLLPKYYLGAGLGRWGMMESYFNNDKNPLSPSAKIYVEIQMTGWLLDGGFLMWILYGGALIVAMWYNMKVASRNQRSELPYLAAVIFGFNAMIIIQSFASPTFNCQLGLEFWFLCSALFGADAFGSKKLDEPIEAGGRELGKVAKFHAAIREQKA